MAPGPRHSAAQNDRLDPAQLVFCALAVLSLFLGINRMTQLVARKPVGHRDETAAILALAIGGAIFIFAWLRTVLFHYSRDTEAADIKIPAPSITDADRVTVWCLPLIVAAGLFAALRGNERWFAIIPLILEFILAVLTFSRPYLRLPEYVFPVVDVVGLTRAIALIIGTTAILRGLLNYRPEYGVSQTLLVVGGTLLLLAWLERVPGLGVRRSGDHATVRPEERASVAPADALSPSKSERPRWLIVVLAIGIFAIGGYVVWRAINPTTGSAKDTTALLAFAGIALVLAVGGERLVNLAVKAGNMEVVLGFQNGTGATLATGKNFLGVLEVPSDASALITALKAHNVELEPAIHDVDGPNVASILYSPLGETFSDSLRRGPARLVKVAAPRHPVLDQGDMQVPEIRQITVRGSTSEVATILARFVPPLRNDEAHLLSQDR